jgi:hypothetical protein
MTCTHLKQLYQFCHDSHIQLSSTDLIHIVCKQCENVEVCPSVLYEEYDKMPEYRMPEHKAEPSNNTPEDPPAKK